MLTSFLFKRYVASPIGPECFTNFLPYSVALGKSLRLLTPGVLPTTPGSSLVMLFTWSFICPVVKVFTSSFNGLPCKLEGIS